ncbi:hypothetical protein BS47DRAFT_1471747 [Hydnum rufescens UP504]|uniref:Cytochrome P450 monooxygenase n=1 Tax=Hydnum rufescens UP504 TaxID=1448309 RepID=A0A9P6ASL1_9AGAM|nr:hypothetical protein BS47DRAFT_1471747 [Hydnum rufescens UP504]
MTGLFSSVFSESNPIFILLGACCFVVICHVVPYLRDPFDYRRGRTGSEIPGPLIAKLSDIWLSRKAVLGDRSGEVHKLHQKYGKVVRIAPNHISIADPDALQIIYAADRLNVLQHGNGSLKTDFYDAFVSIHRGLFNTRDRAEHTRKRKIVSNIFSQKNVLEFEPYIRSSVALLLKKWDHFYDTAVIRKEKINGGCFQGRDGNVWFDCLDWYNYLAFDIIGDLAFGSPFGMLEAGRDAAPVLAPGEAPDKIKHLPAIQILNDRGTYSASWASLLHGPGRLSNAVQNLAGIAVAAVEKRLREPSDRNDLLAKLQEGKDAQGNPMGRSELTAEALTQLIAGSDTTSNSSCVITFYLALNLGAQHKLQAELDEALGPIILPESEKISRANYELVVAPYDVVKSLPYLEACIYEGLRIHSTSAIGLPREVPAGGLTVSGRYYKEGSILSVPSFTIHRDPDVWGLDADIYRPERWFERDKEKMQKAFNPFSWGPRACVGKNLATMELVVIIASIFKRYDIVLESPETPMVTSEGFLRKPVSCRVGVKRREV